MKDNKRTRTLQTQQRAVQHGGDVVEGRGSSSSADVLPASRVCLRWHVPMEAEGASRAMPPHGTMVPVHRITASSLGETTLSSSTNSTNKGPLGWGNRFNRADRKR